MIKQVILVFLVLISIGLSAVTLNYPTAETVDDSLFLGKIGPGQILELRFSRETGPSGTDKAVFWERALIPDEIVINNTLQGNEIIVWVKAPQDERGNYAFNVTMQGDILYILPQSKEFVLDITENVYILEHGNFFSTNAGEQLTIPLRVRSESIARETLTLIDSEGVPLKWVDLNSMNFEGVGTRDIDFIITPNEEGFYNTKLKIGRDSSSYIDLMELDLRVYPTAKSKLRAFAEGFSVSPIIMQPFYSFLSLFGLA